jgi:tRNA (guanine10-N2)-dimethyltransferase
MVNLSRVRKGDLLPDPFCGTGGILIEAGLIGVRVMGSDSDQRMVEGCRKNLEYFNIPGELLCSDVSAINVRVDAVVTDLPYGRAATTRREPIQKLYGRALSAIGRAIKSGGYAVVGSPFSLPSSGKLDLIEAHRMRVHKGLSRYFHVFRQID